MFKLLSKSDLATICDKTHEPDTAEEMRNLITEWKWGTLEMKSLWKALLKAREAVDGAESTKEVQERLPDWPWHHVKISELKETLKCQPDVVDGDGEGEIDRLTSRQRRKGQRLQARTL